MKKKKQSPQTGSPAARGLIRRKPQLMALEPRLMFDGAAVATALAGDALSGDTLAQAALAERSQQAAETANAYTQVDAPAHSSTRHEMVFVDTSVPDWQSLVDGAREGVVVVLLDPTRDGLQQIADRLEGQRGLDAVHVVSHGSAGALVIGGSSYSADALLARDAQLATIGRALSANGDMLLYGCDVGQGSAGAVLIDAIARSTQADVAASSDTTGSAERWGGNWTLETTSGEVESTLFAQQDALDAYEGKLATVDLSGSSGWVAIMFGSSQDPQGDSQAKAADTDIVADAAHGSLYTAYDDGGTNSTADDYLAFRLRVDNPTAATTFGGVAVVGMDANGDGRIDLFMTVDARNTAQVIRLMDPGTGANMSPSTTTTNPLPLGWLPNNGVYAMTASNYAVVAVNASSDPHWNNDNDVGNDGKTDLFVSFKVSMADIAAVLAIASPADRDGNYGPRGATGISGFGKDTAVSYVAFTQTQSGPINADLNGVGSSYDKNASWSNLGAITAPMTPSNPVSASDAASITSPVDSDLINASEDDAFVLSGKATASGWVKLTLTDGASSTTLWVQADGSGNWTAPAQDLSGFGEGTLTFSAELVAGDGIHTAVSGSTGDTATPTHDTTPPTIAVDPLATAGRPTISGTSTDVPAGSLITVTVDPNGDGVLSDVVTYTALVGAGGAWSVNTAAVSPTSGTLAASGLTAYAKITAAGADAAGNTASALALDEPTITSRTTNDSTPTLSGTWGGANGGTDTLSVTVNGTTYNAGDGNLAVSGTTWTLTVPAGDALATGTYDVTATAMRGGSSTGDSTSGELVVVNGPAVAITSSASQADTTPVISGTSTVANGFVTVRIDPNNDGDLSDAITYAVATGASGNWSLDTGGTFPMSGSFPLAGITGTLDVLVTATDSNGAQATANQDLAVVVRTLAISSISSAATSDTSGTVDNSNTVINRTEDNTISVSGTSTNSVGQTVTVTASDGNSGTTDPSGTATVASDGSWTVSGLDLSALNDGYLTFSASVTGASASNTAYTHDATVPLIRFTTASTVDKNSGAVITGTSDLVSGSTITVTLSSGNSGTATVGANGDWSFTTTSGMSGNPSSVTITAAPSSSGTDAAGNKPAAQISSSFAATANFTPTAGAVAIGTIAGDNLIVASEASAVAISGTSTLSSGTTINVAITKPDGTTVTSTSATVGSDGTWSTSSLDFSSVSPNTTLVVTATATVSGVTYTDVALPKLQLGSVATSPTHTVSITSAGDANLSASEDDAVTISGTTANVTSGGVVTLTISDTSGATADVTATATVDASGNWTTAVPANLSSLADGTLTISASVTENSQTATNSAVVNHDTVAPLITVSAGPTASDSTPVLSGTTDLAAGSTLTVAVDADRDGTTDVRYTTTVSAAGTWSVDTASATPTSGSLPSDGLSAISKVTVTGSDGAGNSGSVTAATITGLSTDAGVSGSDCVTNDPTLVFTGRAAAGASVAVSRGGTLIGTVTADAGGVWTLDHTATTLSQGTYSLTAVATESAGVTATATQSITVDLTAPAVAIGGVTSDSGTSVSDFITNDSSLVFSGTAEADSSVLVTLVDADGATEFSVTVSADGSGNWSVDRTGSTLADGSYTLTATVSDSAGNSASDTQAIVVDTTATVSITTNAKTSDTTPVISGTSDLESGRTVSVSIGGAVYTATVDAGGNWSVDLGSATPTSGSAPTLSDGNSYTISASGTDLAGNAATASKALAIDLQAPVVAVTAPIGDGDLNASEDDAVIIGGTSANVPAGATLAVSITDGATTISDTVTVGAGGSWSLAALNLSSMADGVLTVVATYVADDGSLYSGTGTVLHTRGGTVSIDSISQDSGTLGDFVTSDRTLVFSGSASAAATVTLDLSGSSGSFSGVTVTADSSGRWSYDYTGTSLSDGSYTLQAASGGSPVTQAIVVDGTAPSGSVTVNSQSTSDTTPTITGTATLGTGEALTVTVNGVTYTTGDGNLTESGGSWTLAIPADDALTPGTLSGGFDGTYQVVATIRDEAGNTLSDSTSGELVVRDTTAPVIDLDPSTAGSANGSTLGHSVTTAGGVAVSLGDGSDMATVVEATDLLSELRMIVDVGSLQDGALEQLIFGSTALAADGSGGNQSDISVGGVRVNVTYAAGVFTIQKYDFGTMTAAEAQAVVRDIQYRNTDSSYTDGARTFGFVAVDDAGNSSATATATITVQNTAPVLTVDDATVSLGENASSGAITAADADATDADGDALTYGFSGAIPTDGSGNALFAIDSTTGQISLTAAGAAAIDYESGTTSYTLSVKANDGVNDSNVGTITVNLTNVNDNTPALTVDNATVNLAENAAVGAITGADADATDADGNVLTYSFSGAVPTDGSGNALFAINSTTGQISLTAAGAAAIDYESGTTSYTLSVKANDGVNDSNVGTITVNLSNVNDNAPALTVDNATVSLAENATAGAIAGADADATDADGDALTYSFSGAVPTDGSGNALFAINSTTGQISLTAAGAAAIDYESGTTSYTLGVKANDGASDSNVGTITVNLSNENDNTPVLTLDNASVSLAENASSGAITGADADATDADGDTLTYSFSGAVPTDGSGNALFSIDAGTGQISLTTAGAAFVDYEGTNSYTLSVRATDGLNNSNVGTITVNLANVNDNAPALTVDNATVSVAENASAGAIAGADADATDADGDALTYSFSGAIPTDGSGNALFAIDSTTGQISLTAAGAAFIDYESGTTSYTLSVKANDGASDSNVGTITVNLTNVNDNAPVLTVDNATVSVAENASSGAITGADADATDADGDALTYGFSGAVPTDGSGNALFAIDSTTGQISLTAAGAAAIDYESGTTSYTLGLKANDGASDSNVGTITVNLTNVNDNAPVLTVDNATVSLAEDASAGAIAGADADAMDADGDTLTYSFSGAVPTDGSGNALFSIDASTGQISLTAAGAAAIDYESGTTSYTLSVKANDGLNNSNVGTITVSLVNVNDNTPVLTVDNATVNLAENAAVGAITGADADATDADGDTPTYSFSGAVPTDGSGSALFSIDASTGQISLTAAGAAAIDYESGTTSYAVSVRATDGLNSSNVQTITFNLTDVNDNAPVLTVDNATVSLAENAAAGAIAGADADATDADGDALTYSLTGAVPQDGSGNALFSIDSATGQISLTAAGAASIDYETASSYTLSVAASDGTRTSTARTMSIQLTDVDDNAGDTSAPIVAAGQSFSYAENRAASTLLGTVAATDGTGVAGFRFSSTGTSISADGFFSIGADGTVRLTAAGVAAAANDFEQLPNGFSHAVQACDAAGNWSQAVAVGFTLTDLAEPGLGLVLLPSSDTGMSDSDRVTSDTTPTLRITASGSVGDVVTLYANGVAVGSATLTAQDVANGYVDITSSQMGSGLHSFSAGIHYGSGAENRSEGLPVTVDATAPVFTNAQVDGDALTLRYQESGAGMAASSPTADQFVVTLGDGQAVRVLAVTVDPANGTVLLTLERPVLSTDSLQVSYAAAGDGALRDLAGNRVAAATLQAVNATPAATPSSAGAAPTPTPSSQPIVPVRFGGNDFPLAITPFTLPDSTGDIFRSLALEYETAELQLERSVHFVAGGYRDVLTQPAPDAFRVVVGSGGEIALRVFRGIPDQELTGTRAITVQVPLDAFVHTQEDAVVQLNARMAGGGTLPAWLVFDASTGKFTGVVPPGGPAELEVVVEARDRDGRRAEAMFRIKINAGEGSGRASLSQQLQRAMRQPGSHIHRR